MSTLTARAFAEMCKGIPHVPLCEAAHKCGRVATHYLALRHMCLHPGWHNGFGPYVYPVCTQAARKNLTSAPGFCIRCCKAVQRLDWITIAGEVDLVP